MTGRLLTISHRRDEQHIQGKYHVENNDLYHHLPEAGVPRSAML
nr:hypothetical protein [Sodalis-like endosymbiont of Proechinophthirus fluctus]